MARYDLHTHLFTTWEQGRYSLERAGRDADYIIGAVKSAKLDGIALVNFEDIRFEEFAASARGHLGRYRLMREIGNALSFTDEESVFRVIRGQEIPTLQGHVLALAGDSFRRIPSGLGLKETLKQIANLGAVAIADHYKNLQGVGIKNLVENSASFQGYEQFNANFEIVPREDFTELFRHGLNGISVSDSHNKRDLGNGHVETELDFSSEDSLRDSLKEKINSGRFIAAMRKRNSLFSVAEHAGIALYDSWARKRFKWLED
ncbi:MAG: hypothetical protein KKB21_05260 [Nanoarchaeota archaeon]|nr:hypothetical protein [Nanoarchaeota archaeon]MBU4086955.1 hypothetical protein [Nanoarchaeota archaeon]